MNALELRPNTGVPTQFLSPDLILCAGEDPEELMHAAKTVLETDPIAHHHYRCFHFWPFPNHSLTLALTGIGSGCLEPLIWEMVESNVVRRIVLIGTAGYLGRRKDRHGHVYLVDNAYTAGTGVHVQEITRPIKPCFEGLNELNVQRMSGVASDYYYGSARSNDPRIKRAQESDPALNAALSTVAQGDRLIDMETPQFYKLCEIYGDHRLQYAAIRGIANSVGVWSEQTKYAVSVLSESMRLAKLLLSKTRDGSRSDHRTPVVAC